MYFIKANNSCGVFLIKKKQKKTPKLVDGEKDFKQQRNGFNKNS